MRGRDRLCHRSVAARRLRQQRWDLWVNLGTHAVHQQHDEGGGTEGRDGAGAGAVAPAGYLQGDTVSRVSRDKQTQMDRWRLRDVDKGGKRENEGGKLTDVQANKLQGWGRAGGGVMELETALGCRMDGNDQKHGELCCCYSAPSSAAPAVLADLPLTQLLAKSWPRRLGERPGHCGIFLLHLSQHE